MNREAMYEALFQNWKGLPGVVTTSRILKHWTDVQPAQQPAVFQPQAQETSIGQRGQPQKWECRLKLYVYVRTDGGKVPGTVLNPILDGITNLVNRKHPVTGLNDLGGVPGVEWARIDGTIETDEGTLGQQAVAIIPVLILATD